MSIQTHISSSKIFKYTIVGLGAILIDITVYFFLLRLVNINPTWSKRISFVVGGVWSFYGNKVFTFKTQGVNYKEPIAFTMVYLSGFLLNTLTHDWIQKKTMIEMCAVISATLVSVVSNFIGQKYLVFNEKKNYIRSQND